MALRLKTRHFLLIAAVFEHGTLRKVADEMNVSQPAITKALQEMEDILGVPLFERRGRGLAPTPAAELVRQRGEHVLRNIETLAEELQALEAGFHGNLRVGIIKFMSHAPLTAAMAALKAEGMNCSFDIREEGTDALAALLLGHELDCAITRLAREHADELSQEILFEQEPALVTNRAFRVPRGKALTLNNLSDAHWVLYPKETPTRRAIDEMFLRHDARVPQAYVETNASSLFETLVSSNPKGAAIVPREFAIEFSRRGTCKMPSIKLDLALPPVCLTMRSERTADPRLDAFTRAFKNSLARD